MKKNMSDKRCDMCRTVDHHTGAVVLIIIGFVWLLSAMHLITWELVSVLLAAMLILIGVKKLATDSYCATNCEPSGYESKPLGNGKK